MTPTQIFTKIIIGAVCLVILGAFMFATGGFGLGKKTDIDDPLDDKFHK